MNVPPEWLDRFQDFAYYGLLGGFAALVGYCYRLAKQDDTGDENGKSDWSWTRAGLNVMIGLYLGIVVGIFVPDTWEWRDGWVLVIGMLGMKALGIVEKVGMTKLKQVLGGQLPAQPALSSDPPPPSPDPEPPPAEGLVGDPPPVTPRNAKSPE